MYFLVLFIFTFSSFATSDLEDLSRTPKWHKLLHYKKSIFGATESQADGAEFFLHPRGKLDPLAELRANVEAFSQTSTPVDNDPACKFPARLKWLNTELGLPWKVDLSGCKKYLAFFSKLAAKRASIVFSSYYLSNPNSAFGHTLLRLSRYEDSKETEMLDYGVNYSVEASATDPFTYAIKGLFGGFKGRFAAIPYYYKVREYSNYEFRDLWSYDLKLSMKQVLDMVDHVWELGHTDFDYYYFLENCSYHLLALIETVVPEKNLTDEYSLFAVPADTVRLLKREGLIDEGKRRESTYSKLLRLSEGLATDSLLRAQAIVQSAKTAQEIVRNLDNRTASNVLDVAMEAFDYNHAEKILNEDKKVKEEKDYILRARAINPIISPDDRDTSKVKESPAEGHPPTRYTLAEGYRHGQGKETRLQWRAALHDILDPPKGSLKEAQLEIGKVSVNLKENRYVGPKLVLQDLTIMTLKNYPSQSFWASPFSWEFELGMQQLDRANCFDCPESIFMGSVGNSLTIGKGALLFSFLLNGEFNFQKYYEYGYRVGLGPKLVSRLILSEKWIMGLESQYHLGNDQELAGKFELRHHFRQDFSLMLRLKGMERKRRWDREGLLGLQFFH